MERSFAKIFVLTTEISALASSQRRHFFNTLEGKQNFMNKMKITSFNGDNSAEHTNHIFDLNKMKFELTKTSKL